MTEPKTYELKNRIIDIYLQKSNFFLYPLLLINNKIKPKETFIEWEKKPTYHDSKLICAFELLNTFEYKHFEKDVLLKNEFFEDFHELENTKDDRKWGAYIFDLNNYKSDFKLFLRGKYSHFSEKTKSIILAYYAHNNFSKEYADSYLNPKDYFAIYAEHLNVQQEVLQAIGELCNAFDSKKETLTANILTSKFSV